MANLASAPPPLSRPQLSIQRPSTALDSSDEARTDTSTSPSMNPARSPGMDAKGSNDSTAAVATPTTASPVSTNGRRRKADAVVTAGEEKPAPKQRKYERKTKRFIWPDDLHRLFVAAIFDVGLKNASPKALLALMEAAGPNSGLTTEHLKSHLQKYRLNYERSRMEFLEYYDRSAKRNRKRRRQAQQRANGVASEANTMFVFPISNSKRRKGHGSDSDSDDSDSDAGDSNNNDSRMEVDSKDQRTPQRRRGSPAAASEAHERNLNYSQLMQSAQQHQILNGSSHTHQHPQITNDRMIPVVPAPASNGVIPIASHHLPPAFAAHAQRKQASEHDRDLAAAAAAVAAYRYPLGQLPVSGGVPGMPELSDPQWSILNSLMSPQLAGMTGPVSEGGLFPQVAATSEAMARGGSSADGFMLHEEPTDLQMQMHLAMQAQMNLHRQMLTRKVEVAQHLARHNSMGSINSSASRGNPQAGQRGFGESWGSTQQLQQQQYRQHQQQLQQQEHYQQNVNMLSRPSLSTPDSTTSTAVTPASVPTETVEEPATSEAVVVSKPVAGSGPPAAVDNSAGGLTETKSDDDGMDLYRWDRIDLNVELDDDDLFGFLKS
ncbi:Hypothetical protein PHPALM_12807 [Phytophthora palmivora]|uniref:Uncharacterized protein n=1 Tax=Phytophthora palmivora TaxID=4796 RepID=A0A2P4XYT2_9STRA|nr:Hypothetical protein PHPALM_12807 [Phytophthora palmivora]